MSHPRTGPSPLPIPGRAMRLGFVVLPLRVAVDLRAFFQGLRRQAGSTWEVLFLDDGNAQGPWGAMQKLAEAYPQHVKVLRIPPGCSRADALDQAFARTNADVIFTPGATLRDDPALIPVYLEHIEEGFDLVVGAQHSTQGAWVQSLSERLAAGLEQGGFRQTASEGEWRAYTRRLLQEAAAQERQARVGGREFLAGGALAGGRGSLLDAAPSSTQGPENFTSTRHQGERGHATLVMEALDVLANVHRKGWAESPLKKAGLAAFSCGLLGIVLLDAALSRGTSGLPLYALGTLLLFAMVLLLLIGFTLEHSVYHHREYVGSGRTHHGLLPLGGRGLLKGLIPETRTLMAEGTRILKDISQLSRSSGPRKPRPEHAPRIPTEDPVRPPLLKAQAPEPHPAPSHHPAAPHRPSIPLPIELDLDPHRPAHPPLRPHRTPRK